jgi:hypothetical protein
MKSVILFFVVSATVSLPAAEISPGTDQRSYNLSIMGGFAEVVQLGVKNSH